VGKEVTAGSLRHVDALNDSIIVDLVAAVTEDVLDVGHGLLDVAFNIHGKARRLGNRKTEVEGDNGRHAA
jgi:hypothetical protein